MAIHAQSSCTLSTITDVEAVYTYYYLSDSTITIDEAPKDNINPPGASTITVISDGNSYTWQITEPELNIQDDVIQTAVGKLYYIECVEFSDGTYDWGPLMTSSTYAAAKAAYNLSSQALSQAQAANDATALLGGHFLYNSTWQTTNTPHSANVVENIGVGEAYIRTPSQWHYNVHIGANGIKLRYNEFSLSSWTGTALTFYKPSLTSQGNKAMELSSSGLVFYDGSAVNGGNIQAQFGSSGAIQSGDYAINATTDKFSTYGTKIDLVHGEIYSPYFRLSQGTISGGPVAGIYISGTFEATGALIGYQKTSNSDTNAYWKIGYMTDTNQDKLTYQRADNNGFIELAPSATFILQKNKIHTGWFGSNGYLTYPYLNSKYYDFGMNLPTSLSDKFLYIRYNSGSDLSTIYQNDSGWTYPFYVDAEGKVHAQNFYIGDSTTPIGGGSGTIAEKLISGAGSATQPVYFRSDSGHVGEVATTTYQLNAAGAKGVDTSMPTTATDSNVPTTKLMKTFVEGKGYITGYTETDPTVPSWAKASNKPSYGLTEISDTSDLQAIEALTGTNGFLKKTASNTWTLDTNTYLTSYTETDPIFSASAAAGITSTDINNWNNKTDNTGTVTSVRVQASNPLTSTSNTASSTTLDTTIKFSNQNANLVLAGPSSGTSTAAPTFRSLVAADIPELAWSKITSGNDDLKAIEALTGTNGFLKKTASNTWSLDTTTYVPTSRTVNGHALSSNVTVTASDIGLSNVTNYSQITKIGESGDGKLRVWTGDPDGNNYTDVEVHITAYDQSTVSKAEALNLNAKVGDTNKPVYFKADGKPYAINYTIDKSVPSDALFTDHTYEFADSYNASTNKGATVTTVNNAIGNLDVNAIIGTAGQTITSISETNGKISATYSNISITKSQISDFPTELTPASHTHGNISNDGKITSTIVTIANNDTLLFADNSNGGKIERMVAFDGSTTTQALTKKGTWETFSKFSGSYDDLINKPTIPTLPTNIVNTITTTAGSHTVITSKTGNVSFNIPTTAAHVGIKFNYSTSGNNRAVQQDNNGNLYVVQKDDNTNYYHTSGSWGGTNNLTYTATANGGAGALAFTLPTASTSTYGVTKLSSTSSSSEQVAATPKLVYDSINSAASNYVAKSGDEMTGTLKTPELITTKLTAEDVNVTHLLTAEGIQTKNWTTTNISTIDGSFYICPTISCQTGTITYNSDGTLQMVTGTVDNTRLQFDINSLFISKNETVATWTQNSLVMITGEVLIGQEEYCSIGTIRGEITATATSENPSTTSITIGNLTTNITTNTSPKIISLMTAGTAYTFRDLKISLYSYYNNSQENLLGIMMTTAGAGNRTYIDIYNGANQTNGKTSTGGFTYTEPVVRVGNLNGLNSYVQSGKFTVTPKGWGIYTTNGFFIGDVYAENGYIGGFTIGSTDLYNNKQGLTHENSGIYISTTGIAGGAGNNWWIKSDGSFQFGGTTGIRYENNVLTIPAANVSGTLTAAVLTASNIVTDTLTGGTAGNSGFVYISTNDYGSSLSVAGNSNSTWRLILGTTFGVTNTGKLYATGVNISGSIEATSFIAKYSGGTIGAQLTATGLEVFDENTDSVGKFGSSIRLGSLNGLNMRFTPGSTLGSTTAGYITIYYENNTAGYIYGRNDDGTRNIRIGANTYSADNDNYSISLGPDGVFLNYSPNYYLSIDNTDGANLYGGLSIVTGGLEVIGGATKLSNALTVNSSITASASIITGAHVRPNNNGTSINNYCGTSDYAWNGVYTRAITLVGAADGTTNITGAVTTSSSIRSGASFIARAHVRPDNNLSTSGNTNYCGTTDARWNGIYSKAAVDVSSDRKLKNITGSIDFAKELIMNLQPVDFKFIESDQRRKHMGLIAQDVAQTCKEIGEDLSFVAANYITENCEEEIKYYGEDVDDELLTWGIKYEELIAPIIKVVQSQQQEIELLKQRIELLEEGN